jgi:hypothetical protein
VQMVCSEPYVAFYIDAILYALFLNECVYAGGEILLWKLNEDLDSSSSWKLSKSLRYYLRV